MKKYIFIILLLFSNQIKAEDNLKFYIKKALDNNLQLNAERKSFESAKQSRRPAHRQRGEGSGRNILSAR